MPNITRNHAITYTNSFSSKTSLAKYIFNNEIPSVYKSCGTDNASIACFARVIELLPVKKRWMDDDRKETFNLQERVL